MYTYLVMSSLLKDERERRGWTIDYVAQQIGVSGAQVSRIENYGLRAVKTALAITKLFGNVTLDEVCSAEPAKPAARKLPKTS